MNWRSASSAVRYLLNFPGCILVFLGCANATIGLLYIQKPIDLGAQYLPAVAAVAYFLSRMLFAFEKGLKISGNELLGYAFVISTAVSVAIQISLGLDATDSGGLSSLDYTVAMWSFNMLYFFAGAACIHTRYRKSNIVALILLLLVLVPFLAAPKELIFVQFYELKQILDSDRLTHLGISEWCVFLLIGAFAFSTDRVRPLVIIVTVVCLFGLQGRSSTLFTPFTMLLFWMLTGGKKAILLFAGLAILALVTLTFFPIFDSLLDADERALERMLLDADDGSLQGRQAILENSLQHLPASIPYGDPTYIAIEAGTMGSFIHNLLSMWQFFGLLPFLLIVIILIRGLLVMKTRLRRGNLSVMEEIGCMLLIYSSVSVVFSKSIVFYWLWFAAGYWSLQYSGSKRKISTRNDKPRSSRKRRSKRRSKSKRSQALPTGDVHF